MATKYYLSQDEEFLKKINGGSKILPFTTKEIANALDISVQTVRRNIHKYPINEITKERAKELGKAPPQRKPTNLINIQNNAYSPNEVAIMYGIHVNTVKLWIRKGELENKLLNLSPLSYRTDFLSSYVSGSKWKFTSNGKPEMVDVYNLALILKDDIGEQVAVNYENTNTFNALKTFYNALNNCFKSHCGEARVWRQLKLKFIPKVNPKKDVEIGPDEGSSVFRTIKPIYIKDNAVHFMTFDYFMEKIFSFTYGLDLNGVPLSGSDANGMKVLQNYSLDPSIFVVNVEHSLLGRGIVNKLSKTYHAISIKHPYYVLFDNGRKKISPNSCFFDAVILSMKTKDLRPPKNIKELAKKYPNGVDIYQVDDIGKILGIKIQVLYNFTGLDPPESPIYGDFKSEIDEPIQVYYTNTPEPHFYSVVGIRENKYFCEQCKKYFNTNTDLTRHKCLAKTKASIKEQLKEVFCYYDIETVNNSDTLDVEIYSIVWKWSDQKECKSSINNSIITNCVSNFILDLKKRMANEYLKITLCAYNGSGFDLWAIIKNLGSFANFTNTVCANNRFYVLNGSYEKSKFNVFDPFLYTVSSLDNTAKSFGLKTSKIPFSHQKIQQLYNDNSKLPNPFKFIDEIEDLIEEYNKKDVEILEQIVEKLFKEFPGIKKHCTVSSYAFNELKNVDKNSSDFKSNLSEEQYKFIRKAITGGRVQAIEKFKKFENMDLSMIDVVSLYPSVMRTKEFPTGKPKEVDKYLPGFLGVYNCNIKHQKSPVLIPLKSKDKPLDWSFTGEIKDVVLTSVEIECMIKHFGEDCLEISSGLIWETKSSNLFDAHIDKWMQIKKQQDLYKKQESTEYNPVIREMAKKMLNTPYGKTIQRIHDKGFVVSTSSEYTYVKTKTMFKPKDYEYVYVGEGLEILEGVLKDIDYSKAKPIQIGVFILAYSRCKMYDEVFSKTKVYYSDTDSALVETSALDEIGIKIGNGLGEYEVEMSNINEFWSIGPKSYALRNKNGETKMRLKGVSKNSGWKSDLKQGDCLSIETFDEIIRNPCSITFYCSHFHHRKGDFALEYKNIEKTINV